LREKEKATKGVNVLIISNNQIKVIKQKILVSFKFHFKIVTDFLLWI